MIEKEEIKRILEQEVKDVDFFVVAISIHPNDKIRIHVDNQNGITIEECVKISRSVEQVLLSKDLEFELEVSSPGLDMPLKVLPQFEKSIGKNIEVVGKDGMKRIGILKKLFEKGIELEEKKNVKIQGKKKKEIQLKYTQIFFNDIKSTKIFISLK